MLRASSGDSAVLALLANHPRVDFVEPDGALGLRFEIDGWKREVLVGSASVTEHGLVELLDNNPLVCADRMSVPSPAATLALIALGPLAAVGLIAESPTLVLNIPADAEDVSRFLLTAGWTEGISVHSEPLSLDGVAAATVMVAVTTPPDLDDIDAQYEERFGRSFYLRRDETSLWDRSLVLGQPYGCYRLAISVEHPVSLLQVRVLADLNGKLGAAQVIHAMNVMAGFEETLGIS